MGGVIRGKVPSRNFSNRAHITGSVTGKKTEETLVWAMQESGRATLKREGVHVRLDWSLSRVGEDVEACCQRHLSSKVTTEDILTAYAWFEGAFPSKRVLG